MEHFINVHIQFLKNAAGFALPVGFLVMAYYIARYVRDRQKTEVLREINRSLRLSLREARIFVRPMLSGEFSGFNFFLALEKTEGRINLLIVLRQVLDISGHISVRMESAYTKAIRHIGVEDTLTGDDEFDNLMICEASDTHYITAFMNSEARSKILRIVSTPCKIYITMRGIEVRYPYNDGIEGKSVHRCMNLMADIMQEFSRNTGVRKRLIENGILEPDGHIRLKNLQALVLRYPLDDEMREFLKSRLKDTNVLVQVEAARYLGDKGHRHLAALLESGKVKDISLGILIATMLPADMVRTDVLMRLYSEGKGEDMRLSVLRVIREKNDPSMESFLCSELPRSEGKVRDMIIDILAGTGTLDCIEVLYRTGKDSMNPLVKQAVTDAIASIQYRHGSGEKGWLSVTEEDPLAGALSVDDTPGKGALSRDGEKKK